MAYMLIVWTTLYSYSLQIPKAQLSRNPQLIRLIRHLPQRKSGLGFFSRSKTTEVKHAKVRDTHMVFHAHLKGSGHVHSLVR